MMVIKPPVDGERYRNPPIQNDSEHDGCSVDDNSSAAIDEFLLSRIDNILKSDEEESNDDETDSPSSLTEEEKKEATPPHTPQQDRRSPQITPEKVLSTPATPTGKRLDSPSTASTSRQQQRQNPQWSPMYNPYSNYTYSPTRSPRKEIMGMSVVTYADSLRSMNGLFSESSYHGNDDSSGDSEEALERYARKIRIELRHAEMVELAMEAERAAEAGEEKFTAKPSTYGTDDGLVGLLPAQHKPAMMRRHRSYSEGQHIALRQTPSSKIGILALRDVNEVFPAFGQFHTHLRTHLARNRVRETALFFHEQTESTVDRKWNAEGWKALPPKISGRHRMDFLDSFGLNRWVGPGAKQQSGKLRADTLDVLDESDSSDIGDLLAEHILSHVDPQRRQRPKVEMPPGLEEEEIEVDSTRCRPSLEKWHKTSSQTVETEPTTSSSENDQQASVPSIPLTPEVPSPRALFNDDESEAGSIESNHRPQQAAKVSLPSLTPKNASISAPPYAVPDLGFVTPARLRKIRGRRKGFDKMTAEAAGLLLPTTNSLDRGPLAKADVPKIATSLSASLVQPVLDVEAAATATESRHSSLQMPTFAEKSRDKDSNCDATLNLSKSSSAGPKVLLPIRRVSGLEKEKASSPVSLPAADTNDALDSSRPIVIPRETVEITNSEMVAPRTPNQTKRVVGGRESSGLKSTDSQGKQKARKVKVSVYASSPSSDRKLISGGSEQVLQHTQLLRFEREARPDDKAESIQTPQPNCLCLSLSQDSENSDTPNESKEKQKNPIRRSISTGSLHTLQNSNAWMPFSAKNRAGSNCSSGAENSFRSAMSVFSRLSPGKLRSIRNGGRRALYVREKQNDDFLNNYLYCSKSAEEDEGIGKRDPFCDPFQDVSMSCGELTPGFCCGAVFGESTIGLVPRRSYSTRQLVSLSGSASATKVEPETWFDIANERFDSVLETLVGNDSRHGNEWNVSFQAPTLKKSVGTNDKPRASSIASEEDNALHVDEKTTEEEQDLRQPPRSPESSRLHMRHLSVPQPLLSESQPELTDTQFQLIYGMPKEQFEALTAAGRIDKPSASTISANVRPEAASLNGYCNAKPEVESKRLEEAVVDSEVVVSRSY